MRIVLTQVRKVPKLQDCNPQSFMAAVLTGTQLGLEFGREAHLVPFKGECQLIPDYKGIVQLAYRSGLVESIVAENVYSKEQYAYRPASNTPIVHTPLPPSERGEHVATYAVAWIKGSERPIGTWLWAEDVRSIMHRSAAVKFGGDTPWKTDFAEMAKKTAVKRLAKMLPASAEFAQAVALDNQAEAGESQDFVDVSTVQPTDEGDSRTRQVAKAAAAKVEEATGKAPSEPAGDSAPETTPEVPQNDGPATGVDLASNKAVLKAVALYVKLAAGVKERIRGNFGFKSTEEFKTWSAVDLDNLIIEMEGLVPTAERS